jgi:hypothetical protein
MLRTIAFAFVMILYLWFPWNLIHQQERILREGTQIRLQLQPVDPYDIFRGRYIQLFYGNWEVAYQERPVVAEPVYLRFRTDTLGFQQPDRIDATPPAGEPYLTARVLYIDEEKQTAQIEPPETLLYYYMNDEIAPLAEQYFRELNTLRPDQPEQAYAQVRLLKGEARIEQVFLSGQPVGAYVRERLSTGKTD